MITTETINEKTKKIGSVSTREAVEMIQQANIEVVTAVGEATEQIAAVADAVAERLKAGGHLYYVGCGTSGRLGVIDASECPPTFGVSPDTVVGIIAGGDTALRHAIEGAEDNREEGAKIIAKYGIGKNDAVIGISASGGAAYVCGAMEEARARGAFTASISSNEGTKIGALADIAIVAKTGAEVIAGSTRMKAGTSQKLILNMISTCVMIRLGCVYDNMMINLRPTNIKLRGRMIRIVEEITGKSAEESESLLASSEWSIRAAIDKVL